MPTTPATISTERISWEEGKCGFDTIKYVTVLTEPKDFGSEKLG